MSFGREIPVQSLTNGWHRVRYQVQYANPLNYGMEARKLAEIIKTYNADSDSLFMR